MSSYTTLQEYFKNAGDPSHHTYIIEGASEETPRDIEVYLKESRGIEKEQNPDYLYLERDSFTVGDARELKGNESKRGVSEGARIFVIKADSFTREAQNALLKILEEPQGDSIFFILVPRAYMLLPTLRSRGLTISLGEGRDTKEAKKFISSTPHDRLKVVEKYIKEERTQNELMDFLVSLEEVLYTKAATVDTKKEFVHAFSYLEDAKNNLLLQGATRKGILEHLAIVLPVVHS